MSDPRPDPHLGSRPSSRPGGSDLRLLRECPDCGCISRLPPLRPGTDAHCPRCDRVLRRARRRPVDTALACTIAALLFYVLAATAPFLELRLHGHIQSGTLPSAPEALEQQGWWPLAAVVLATTLLMPLAKILLLLTVLLGLRLPDPPDWLHIPFRWVERIGPWAMIEVFLLGLFVAYTRLVKMAEVDIETASYALVGLMLAMAAADAALDPDAVWEEMEHQGCTAADRAAPSLPAAGPAVWPAARPNTRPGARLIGCDACHLVSHAAPGDPCPRCCTALRIRKPASLGRTTALVAASALLYIPANAYPVMSTTLLGRSAPHTILGGVKELVAAGLWPLALLVFIASITVPVLKLIGLTLMAVFTHRGSAWRLQDRTRLYRVVDFIGRWSMIDVFMVAILVALVRFGQIAHVVPGPGAVAFAAVVVLTMLAAESFDPRLMWDVADEGAEDDAVPDAAAGPDAVPGIIPRPGREARDEEPGGAAA